MDHDDNFDVPDPLMPWEVSVPFLAGECPHCGLFFGRKYEQQKYCSQACYHADMKGKPLKVNLIRSGRFSSEKPNVQEVLRTEPYGAYKPLVGFFTTVGNGNGVSYPISHVEEVGYLSKQQWQDVDVSIADAVDVDRFVGTLVKPVTFEQVGGAGIQSIVITGRIVHDPKTSPATRAFGRGMAQLREDGKVELTFVTKGCGDDCSLGLDPKTWTWETNQGNFYTLEEMTTQHIVYCMRMIWNRYFCVQEPWLKPVKAGTNWNLSTDKHHRWVQAMHMFAWEMSQQRKYWSAGDPRHNNTHDMWELYKDITSRLEELRIDEATTLPEIEIPKEFFMTKKIIVVGVGFAEAPNRGYEFLTVLKDLKADDLVVCRSASGALSIGKILSVDIPRTQASSWIVQKIDTTDVDTIVGEIKEAKALQKQLDEKLEILNREKVYDELVKKDPEAAEALKRLKEIGL